MILPYPGMVDVVLIAAYGSEHVERLPAIVNEIMPGLFELSTPHKLPAARGSHTICLTLNDGQTLGGDVRYVGGYGLTFSRSRGEERSAEGFKARHLIMTSSWGNAGNWPLNPRAKLRDFPVPLRHSPINWPKNWPMPSQTLSNQNLEHILIAVT